MSELAQGLVDQDLTICIQQIIGHQNHRHRFQQLSADILSAQPLLQLTKRKNRLIVSRYDFTINNDSRRQRAKWLDQLRKAMGDLIHGPRVDRDSSVLDVRLSADTIKLVFDQKLFRHGPSYIGQIGGWWRQHELYRMKKSNVDVAKIAGTCARRCFTNVAQQHVCVSDIRQWLSEDTRYRILHQSFS